ncbi:hypothetical protein ACH41H_44375 [Streptomyces sp. NPDC020800]
MTLKFIGPTSDSGQCLALYEVEDTGDIVVRDDQLTDPEEELR